MKTETILYGISAIAILAGIWTLYYSLKKWNPEYKPRKVLAKLIRELLGSKGSQIFSGIMGTLLIIFGIGITYLTLTNYMVLRIIKRDTSDAKTKNFVSNYYIFNVFSTSLVYNNYSYKKFILLFYAIFF